MKKMDNNDKKFLDKIISNISDSGAGDLIEYSLGTNNLYQFGLSLIEANA